MPPTIAAVHDTVRAVDSLAQILNKALATMRASDGAGFKVGMLEYMAKAAADLSKNDGAMALLTGTLLANGWRHDGH